MDLQMRVNGSDEPQPSGEEIRASVRRRTNKISDPRLLAAMDDPRVTAIEDAVRGCDAGGSYRRENIMYRRTIWPRHIVVTIDDLRQNGATREQLLLLGEALKDAVTAELFAGAGAPTESLGVALQRDATAEHEVRLAAVGLIDAPTSVGQKRTLLQRITREIASSEFVRRVLQRDIARAEARPQ
jgi:hypothetical protein